MSIDQTQYKKEKSKVRTFYSFNDLYMDKMFNDFFEADMLNAETEYFDEENDFVLEVVEQVIESNPNISSETVLLILNYPKVRYEIKRIVLLKQHLDVIKQEEQREIIFDGLSRILAEYPNNLLIQRRITGYPSLFILILSLIFVYLRPQASSSSTTFNQLFLNTLNMVALLVVARNQLIDNAISDNAPNNPHEIFFQIEKAAWEVLNLPISRIVEPIIGLNFMNMGTELPSHVELEMVEA